MAVCSNPSLSVANNAKENSYHNILDRNLCPSAQYEHSTQHFTDNIIPFQIPLKHNMDNDGPEMCTQTRKIFFSDHVSVLLIPMRNEYSSWTKKRLWNNRFETNANIARNTVEFAAEGWNWRMATEDEGMYKDAVSGALIHPVHCTLQGHRQHNKCNNIYFGKNISRWQRRLSQKSLRTKVADI